MSINASRKKLSYLLAGAAKKFSTNIKTQSTTISYDLALGTHRRAQRARTAVPMRHGYHGMYIRRDP